jgi:hypothetical protein
MMRYWLLSDTRIVELTRADAHAGRLLGRAIRYSHRNGLNVYYGWAAR